MFGGKETATDRWDYLMALAGLSAGIHSLRVLAERGIATPADIRVARVGIEGLLDQIPADQVPAEQIQSLKDMLLTILLAAVQAEDDREQRLTQDRP